MKVTVKVATPGFGVHRASSTRSSFTGRVKSYAAPRSIHPLKVKSTPREGFAGASTRLPSATLNSIRLFPSANVPPFATKTTVYFLIAGVLSCHSAFSTMSFVTVSVVKSYAAPFSVHPWKVKPSLAGSAGCCALFPLFTSCTGGSGLPP